MHILVTGGAGFIGSHLVAELLARSPETRVTVADDFSTGDWQNLKRATDGAPQGLVDLLVGDFHQPRVLERVTAGVFDAVLHQAAITDTTYRDQPRLFEVNYTGTLALLDACQQAGCPLLMESSASVYGNPVRDDRQPFVASADRDRASYTGPLNAYAFSKSLVDELARRLAKLVAEGGVIEAPIITFRYFNVFGMNEQAKGKTASVAYQFVMKTLRDGRVPCFEDAFDAARDWVPVEVVTATVLGVLDRALADPSWARARIGAYNVGTGSPLTFRRVLELCAEARGTTVEALAEPIPNPFAKQYQYFTCAETSETREALGVDPARSEAEVEEAIRRLLATLDV